MRIEVSFEDTDLFRSGDYTGFTLDETNCAWNYSSYETDSRWQLHDHFLHVKGKALINSSETDAAKKECHKETGETAGW